MTTKKDNRLLRRWGGSLRALTAPSSEEKIMKNLTWSFGQIWNESLKEARQPREPQTRDVIWASELGKSYLDLYLTMKGEKPTNDFSDTALRKFDAGIIWEKIIEVILKRAGILLETQEWLKNQIDGCVTVTGKLDFLVGGKTDKEKAKFELEKIKDILPENVYNASLRIIDSLPDEINQIVLEIKSISSFMFDKYQTSGIPNANHRLQLMHYLICKNLPEGHIVYVSKDDARLLELGVFNPSVVNEEYEKFIKEFSAYWNTGQEPPKEKEIVFDEEWGKFVVNWKVMYSRFLTKIYGYKDQEEVRAKFEPMVASWNRVLTRIKDGKDMTKDNLEKIKEMEKWGYNLEKLKQYGNKN